MSHSIAELVAGWNRDAAREIEVLGLKFRVRGLPLADRIAFVEACTKASQDPSALAAWSDAEIVRRGLCGPDGELLQPSLEDLAQLDSAIATGLARAIIRASGIGEGDPEGAEKN